MGLIILQIGRRSLVCTKMNGRGYIGLWNEQRYVHDIIMYGMIH